MTMMHNPASQGELPKEFLGSTTATEFAKHIGVARAAISRILNGRTSVSGSNVGIGTTNSALIMALLGAILLTGCGGYTGGAKSVSIGTYGADTGQGDRHAFDLYNAGEWDAVLNPSFSGGTWVSATPGTIAKMARGITYGTSDYKSYVYQGLLWYSGSNVASELCMTNSTKGTIATAEQRMCLGFTGAGFIQDTEGKQTVLVPPASLIAGNWYTVTMWNLGGSTWTASLLMATPGSTLGGFTFITGISAIPEPTNFQVESTGATDIQKNIRYAVGGEAQFTFMIPMAKNAPNIPTLVELLDANSTATWALIPASYRPGVPSRWVIFNHGYNESGQGITNEGGHQTLTNALVQAGYVVIASDYASSNCMGNHQCVIDVGLLQKLWSQYLDLTPRPYAIGESMGGIVTWNAIANGTLHPRAVVGIYPICNLAAVYADSTNSYLQTAITASYAITNINPYAIATSGYNPMLDPMTDFTSFPILMWSSYSDVTVYRTTNEDPFAAAINAAGGNAVIHTSTGTHRDISNFDPPAVVDFFNAN
jgi:hypothetical protein